MSALVFVFVFPTVKSSIKSLPASLRGWAKLDTAAGESAIQNNVTWGIANYTDATARQYLIKVSLPPFPIKVSSPSPPINISSVVLPSNISLSPNPCSVVLAPSTARKS
jgi:hypothetical protein